jgi:mannose/fructose-specific phosphotransferase system component IIA
MSEGLRGIIIAHSELADGLIAAVQRIAGMEEGVLVALSNEGLGPQGLRDRLEELMGEGPAVIFSDLREGSCGMVAQQLCLSRPGQVLVTGANLPMLLDFVLMRHLPVEELVERIVERGRSGIQSVPART